MHALYAIPHSLYSGRARSYLIKNSIPFREFSCGHESFKAEILPEAKLAHYSGTAHNRGTGDSRWRCYY